LLGKTRLVFTRRIKTLSGEGIIFLFGIFQGVFLAPFSGRRKWKKLFQICLPFLDGDEKSFIRLGSISGLLGKFSDEEVVI